MNTRVIHINHPWLVFRYCVDNVAKYGKDQILPLQYVTFEMDGIKLNRLKCIAGPRGWIQTIVGEWGSCTKFDTYILMMAILNQFSFLAGWFGEEKYPPLTFIPCNRDGICDLAYRHLSEGDPDITRKITGLREKLEQMFGTLSQRKIIVRGKIAEILKWFDMPSGLRYGYTLNSEICKPVYVGVESYFGSN